MTTKTRGENSVHLTLQEAITQVVFHSLGPDGESLPPKAIAAAMNVREKTLYDIADPHRRRDLKAHEIPLLVRATDNFLILDVLEYQLRRVAYALPTAHTPGALLTLKTEAVQAFGLWMQRIALSRPFTPEDLEELEAATLTMIGKAQAALAQARQEAESPTLTQVPRAVGGDHV